MENGHYTITADVEVIGSGSYTGLVSVKLASGLQATIRAADFDFEPKAPEEPPHNSVVLDRDGDAWQSEDGDWSMTGARENGEQWEKSWAYLVDTYGPIKVIHTP